MKLASIVLLLASVSAYQHYCWCKCESKSLVKPIEKCTMCTKEFCLEEDPKLCTAEANNEQRQVGKHNGDNVDRFYAMNTFSGEQGSSSPEEIKSKLDARIIPPPESSIIIQCFQVESLKETLIVYLFIAGVGSLLGFILYTNFRKT